jgi:hypothetical protein
METKRAQKRARKNREKTDVFVVGEMKRKGVLFLDV